MAKKLDHHFDAKLFSLERKILRLIAKGSRLETLNTMGYTYSQIIDSIENLLNKKLVVVINDKFQILPEGEKLIHHNHFFISPLKNKRVAKISADTVVSISRKALRAMSERNRFHQGNLAGLRVATLE